MRPVLGCSTYLTYQVESRPVEHKVILIVLPRKQVLKHPLQIRVVRSVFEPQTFAVIQIGGELGWEASA